MKVKHIEILPHARNPAGSFAIIRLYGINKLDGPSAFTIEPVGAGRLPGRLPDGWPNGEQTPIGVRAGINHVDLLIGPEIVRAEPLRAGVDVRFRIPRSEIDVTVAWPNLSAAPKKPAPSEGLARLQLKTVAHPPQSASVEAAPTQQESPPRPGQPGITRAPAKVNRTSKRSIGSAAQNSKSANLNAGIDPKAVSAYTGFRARAEAARIAEAQASHALPPFLVPGLLGLAVVAALFVTFVRTTPIDTQGTTLLTAWTSGDSKANGSIRLPTALLAEILNAGVTSPSGTNSSDVSPRQALERANNILASAKTEKDREEAAYWLRRALSHTLTQPRLIWAVTQLGAAHASSENGSKPNYQASQVLWSWAADAGDAQAACFLGQLYERGLGTAQDAKRARAAYERAQRLGGCPGLEQAMLRVRN